MSDDTTSFHPINEPYISYGNRNIRKPYHTIAYENSIIPSYESESLLKYSQMSETGNYPKQIYSQSSTNINIQSYDLTSSEVKMMSKPKNQEKHSLQYSISQHNNENCNNRSVPSLTENENQSVRSINQSQINRSNNNRSQQEQNQSTQILHEKIFYLEKELQELTKILQEESKHSYSGQEYEELAIENAQLTIKVQELEEKISKINAEKSRTESELLELGQEYEREHQINNELRERLLELQQKITAIEKNSISTISQIESQNNNESTSTTKEKNSYTASLERENTRLNEEIENLLTQMHNNNIDFNEEQSAKEELMNKMNEQLLEIEKLRKELSDMEVEKLELNEMNQYLKKEINQVNSMSLNKIKETQEKYIKEDLQRQETQQELENFNMELQRRVQELEDSLEESRNQNDELRKKLNNTSQKSEPFKDLFDDEEKLREEIDLLNQEIREENERHSLIKKQYIDMLKNQETQINELENENRKALMENRTLKIEIEDRKKEIEELQEECEKIAIKTNEMKLSRNLEISRFSETEKMRYEENIKSLNEQNKRLLEEKEQQFRDYQNSVKRVEDELQNTRYEVQKLSRTLELREEEIRQKDYLAQELLELQKSHEQLIEEVKLIKKSKVTLQEEMKMKEETLKNEESEVMKYKRVIDERMEDINRLELMVKNQDLSIDQLKQENANLKEELKKMNSEKRIISEKITPSQQPEHSSVSCPLCPEVLKEFNIYKELMELKFETMNEMLDEMKISFIRAEFEMKDEINKDKSKYEYWIQKYDTHDKEYRILMERLWEWEKINARNEMMRNDINSREHRPGSMPGNLNRQPSYDNNGNNSKSNQPSGHLSELEYDLYLIKLENSTLRSQIANLEKELTHKGKNPETQRQIEQLKRYSDNLLSENEELKNRLTQIVSQKKIPSSNDISSQYQQGKNLSIFERYSQDLSSNLIERTKLEEKALASAELFINKLKKENDNLIETKRMLEQELDQELIRNRSLMNELESEKDRNRRENEMQRQHTQKTEVLDRYNLPIEYIKYHPEHKKLQNEYVALKRAYLEMELQYKKSKESLEENLQKLQIENDFHQERINELEKNEKSANLFSFNHNFHQSKKNEQESNQTQKNLEQRCIYLENQLQIKEKEFEVYVKKYESLMKEMAFNPKTPRRKTESMDRIDKIAENIDVSPIQSPQWQQNSAQQNSDRLFDIGQISFDEKYVEKLKSCMDKKMIELEITPRETSNMIIKATWFIERLATDIKELRNNIEILKGQRKAIMKERNELKEKLENVDEVSVSDRSKPFAKNKTNHVLDDSINTGLNKIKISKGYQSVPKLDFDSKSQTLKEENIEVDENQFNNVIKETLELKNQRRNGLKKFQQQV